jgi:hypothetical protein
MAFCEVWRTVDFFQRTRFRSALRSHSSLGCGRRGGRGYLCARQGQITKTKVIVRRGSPPRRPVWPSRTSPTRPSASGEVALAAPAFQELLVQQLCGEAAGIIARGLHRQYQRQQDEPLGNPRGRIDFGALAGLPGRPSHGLRCPAGTMPGLRSSDEEAAGVFVGRPNGAAVSFQ